MFSTDCEMRKTSLMSIIPIAVFASGEYSRSFAVASRNQRISYTTYWQWVDEGLPVREFGRYRRISGREFNAWAETRPLAARPADAKEPREQPKEPVVQA